MPPLLLLVLPVALAAKAQNVEAPAPSPGSCAVSTMLGCFKDSDPACKELDCRGPRLLNFTAARNTKDQTLQTCAERCCAAGYSGPQAVAGVEFGVECYCARSFDLAAHWFKREPLASCAKKTCPGNASQSCGDSYRISVYRSTCSKSCRAPGPPPAASCWSSPAISGEKFCDRTASPNERVADLLPRLSTPEKLARLEWGSHAPPIARLGLPAMYHMECQHGIWNGAGASATPTGCLVPSGNSSGCPTSFPVLAVLGASFNKSAVHAVASAISTEARALHNVAPGRDGTGAMAALTVWSPNTNLIKDARWGRGGTETFSEDSYHTAELVKEYVRGLQGDGPVRKLSATCKHTFGYQLENWQPSGDPDHWPDSRASSHNNITDQDLYSYYLKPFEACIEAEASGMMCSYVRSVCSCRVLIVRTLTWLLFLQNEVNQVPTCANGAINNEHYRSALNWSGFMVP